MKKFSFRLDRLLNYRRYLEKQAQKDLFSARHEAVRRQKALKRLIEKRTEREKRFREERDKGMEVSWYRIYQSFFQKSDHDLELARIRLEKGEERVRSRVDKLEKMTVRKKTLEVLKDIQYQKYRKALGREEQKVMDETAVMGRNRKP